MSNEVLEFDNTPPTIQPKKNDSEYRCIHVNFLSEDGVAQYAKLINRSISATTKELWFPQKNDAILSDLFQFDEGGYHESKKTKAPRSDDDLNTDLFDFDYDPGFYELHWQNMPEFHQPDSGAVRQISHYFKSEVEIKVFAKLVDQNITDNTNSIWFPYREKNDVKDLYWISK
jgi:hypothetical protein